MTFQQITLSVLLRSPDLDEQLSFDRFKAKVRAAWEIGELKLWPQADAAAVEKAEFMNARTRAVQERS